MHPYTATSLHVQILISCQWASFVKLDTNKCIQKLFTGTFTHELWYS